MLFYDTMARPTSSSLTRAQKRVLDVVLRRERLEMPNFISDLVGELSLKAESSLGPTLQRMVRVGVILLQGGGVRGRQRLVVPTPKGRLLGEFLEGNNSAPLNNPSPARLIPLLGTIPAGPLQEVITQEHNDFEAVSVEQLLNHRPGDFLLRIKGDSMSGDGILEGDLVLLRPNVEVQQGEIAAVLWSESGAECEATLKRVFRRPVAHPRTSQKTSPSALQTWNTPEAEAEGEVLLRASNPAYADRLLPAASVRIAGVFRGLIRAGSTSTSTSQTTP